MKIIADEDLERRAREIWDEQQAAFPVFVRRAPDELDRITGTWDRALARAAIERLERFLGC